MLIACVFFVKQKSAYELRMRDWSSDVCSSDLSDTQIGALIGFGFVIFYSVLGLPFGALADRANRRNLILFGLVAWSLATSASGFAGGFTMLLMMRALVGVGEATLSPSAYSTIADRFPPIGRASCRERGCQSV